MRKRRRNEDGDSWLERTKYVMGGAFGLAAARVALLLLVNPNERIHERHTQQSVRWRKLYRERETNCHRDLAPAGASCDRC